MALPKLLKRRIPSEQGLTTSRPSSQRFLQNLITKSTFAQAPNKRSLPTRYIEAETRERKSFMECTRCDTPESSNTNLFSIVISAT
jgi:hypothetical protein